MWIAPPSGLRLSNAITTASVSFATSSRTRAEPAPWPPLTARNAFVIAIEIFAGSKPTTAPLRRITLKCAKRGSAFDATGLPGSPASSSRGGVATGEPEVAAMRMSRTPLSCLDVSVAARQPVTGGANRVGQGPAEYRPGSLPPTCRRRQPAPPSLSTNLLYVVFSLLFNTKHSSSGGAVQGLFAPQERGAKGAEKQRAKGCCANHHPCAHRLSTVLSTARFPVMRERRRAARRRCRFATTARGPRRRSRAGGQFEERASGDHHDALAFGGSDIRKPGEAPERRQDRAARAEHE